MDVEKFSTGACPIGRALALVGDGWSLMILRDANYGITRFDQFRTSLGVAPNILTQRLKALTAAGLLEKRRYSERPPRDEYVVTAAGRDFAPVLLALGAWGRRHNGEGEVSRMVDAETGVPIDPVVVDRTTGLPVGERRMRLKLPGDGGEPSKQG
jgi:DNA-binding HxlR family transcriptional regulator